MSTETTSLLQKAAEIIRNSSFCSAFTGAGISVESGIPPFRGENGLWSKFDPSLLELSYFYSHPRESWGLLKKIFYESFATALPNEAHYVLARLEEKGILKGLITQNIDNLHYRAGNRKIVEYHGTLRTLSCVKCGKSHTVTDSLISPDIPTCECGGILKPDIVFFGESIPDKAITGTSRIVGKTDCMLVIGTTGEIFPASLIPHAAKQNGAQIIEVNISSSTYTHEITDIFLQGKASYILKQLEEHLT